MPREFDYGDVRPSALMQEAIRSVESVGVMTPVKWAAQFISDLSLHVVKEDYEALEKIKAQSDEIGGIRATLLVNFGEGRENNKYAFSVSESESTHAILIAVLKGLVGKIGKLKGGIKCAISQIQEGHDSKWIVKALAESIDEN